MNHFRRFLVPENLMAGIVSFACLWSLPSLGDPLDPDNVYTQFDAFSNGDGSSSLSFNSMTDAVDAANDQANIRMDSGTSTDTFAGASALGADSKALTPINNTPGDGLVTIGGAKSPLAPAEIGHPSFLSPHASPIVVTGGLVYVVNTPSDTLDVIDDTTRNIVARIDVGIDPVGLAVRPDGNEVWVTNHVSDSVSVIDTDPSSVTYHQVIATVQDIDLVSKAIFFDEPVGIAFASNAKAYVALSSENQIAVIDVATRQVVDSLDITAQDPRAIFVRGNRLYVIPFESN